ncbi:phage integrase [Bartonella tribocorum]|nr:hypothetical protein [Bartonella tribocorum]CDO49938.1 phage integrase [Bartonella tribocorum]
MQLGGILFYMRVVDPIKERNSQACEAMRHLHYLKDIALNAFESHKAELKE